MSGPAARTSDSHHHGDDATGASGTEGVTTRSASRQTKTERNLDAQPGKKDKESVGYKPSFELKEGSAIRFAGGRTPTETNSDTKSGGKDKESVEEKPALAQKKAPTIPPAIDRTATEADSDTVKSAEKDTGPVKEKQVIPKGGGPEDVDPSETGTGLGGPAEVQQQKGGENDNIAHTPETPTELRQRKGATYTSEERQTGGADSGVQETTEEGEGEETEFGSVRCGRRGSRGGGVLADFFGFCRKHKVFVMSVALTGGLSGAVGAFIGAFTYHMLWRNPTTPVTVSSSDPKSWEVFQETLEKRELEMQRKLRTEIETFKDNYTKEITSKTTQELQEKIGEAKSDITKVCDDRLERMEQDNMKLIDDTKSDLTKTFEEKVVEKEREVLEGVKTETEELKKKVEQRLQLEPAVMDIKGFMNIETYGPLLVVLPLVEMLLVWLCWRFCARNPMTPRRNGATNQNGDVVQALPEARRAQLIRTDNNNIAVLCFRNDDEDDVNRWADQLLHNCSSAPRKRVHVIDSLDDVTTIPPCRAALVFADPDEREMIIEDERHHIGQGLRRQAVQRLLDSGVIVFIIVYHDKNKNDLTSGQLYNRKLGQIDEHAQLKRLKGQDRVVSMKDSLKPWQTDHLIRQIDAIFSNR